MSNHNGWNNWETWRIFTCLTNDPEYYRDIQRLLASSGSYLALAREIETYVREIHAVAKIDGMSDDEIVRVDWAELAKGLALT